MSTELKAVDAFCGCGGTSLGLKKAGFRVECALEVDSWAAETYMLNHPDTHVFYDIRATPACVLMDVMGLRRGDLDLLTGCPPCQGFSSIRTLNAAAATKDERNSLIFEFGRLIDELLPKAILLENVPGLMTNWRFTKFVRQLKRLGYHVTVAHLDAADFGVPQRRKRLVLGASLIGTVDLSPPKVRRVSVRNAIGSLPSPEQSGRWMQRWHSQHSEAVLKRIRGIPKDGGSRRDLGYRKQLDCHRKSEDVGFGDVYGRMCWDDVSPTITRFSNNPSKGRFLHPDQDRALTLLESSILQGFPRSYRFSKKTPPTMIASMIGEAFPPAVAKELAARVASLLGRDTQEAVRG